MIQEIEPIVITPDDEGRLRIRLIWTIAIIIVLWSMYLILGPMVPVITGQAHSCMSGDNFLSPFLLNSSINCLGISAGRLVIDVLLLIYAVWLTAAAVGEKDWKGLKKTILTPDGNESPALLFLGISAFLLYLSHSVVYTALPNFFIGLAFRLARGMTTALIFNFIVIRLLGIHDLDAYLRENVAPFTNGLPLIQWGAFMLTTFFWLAIGL